MASTRLKIKPTQRAHVSETTERTLKERVVVTTAAASRSLRVSGTTSKSLLSKIKLAVAPSRIICYKNDAPISPASSRDVLAQERADKSTLSKDKNATPPSKIPRLKHATEHKGVSIFTKFKRVVGISKIPRLKREDQLNLQGVPSPAHSVCRGDPFAAYGDSFYKSDKRASAGAVAVLAAKPVVDDVQIETRHPAATLVFPPVKPLNIVKKRTVVQAQANVLTPSAYVDNYPRPRTPAVSSYLDTGLPPNYCVAGARYHAPHACDARKTIPSIVSSKANQITKNDNVVKASEQTLELSHASGDAILSTRTRQSTLFKIKQSLRKSARSIFKPTISQRTRVSPAPVHRQGPGRPSVGRTTTFVDITQSTPSPEENNIRKPTIILSPAKKVHRPRGSIPPISGLMMPDKCRSAHGICQLRRQGKATGLVCICYKKFMKSRQKFANYAPAILSDIIEDRPVTFFPRRRSFNLDGGARYLLSLYLDHETDRPAQNVSQVPQLVFEASRVVSSSSSFSISNNPVVYLSPVSVSSSPSVLTLAQSLDHVYSLESNFLSVSDNSLDNVSSPLDDSLEYVSLSISENDIEPVTSLMENALESLSLSPLSISDENLKSVVPVSPSFSILDEYFDTVSLSPSLSSLNESPESITPRIEGHDVTGDALDSRDSVTISSECHTPSSVSILDIPLDNLRSFESDTKALSKKNNRSARILPSTSLGLGISVNENSENICPVTTRHGISVDAVEKSSPVMGSETSRRLRRPILSINTSACSSTPSIQDFSDDSLTTPSRDNGDVPHSSRKTPTSFSISPVDVENSRSRRAAMYGYRLPIGAASSLPSRRVAIYGSVSPRQRASPVPRTSLGLAQPICFVDAINRSAVQAESVRRLAARPDPRTSMPPVFLARHEPHANAQYAAPQRTRRHDLTAPLPF